MGVGVYSQSNLSEETTMGWFEGILMIIGVAALASIANSLEIIVKLLKKERK